MSSSDPVIPASSSEVSGFENSMTSHRRVLLRGTARLPTRCASPFRRKKKTHCSISLDRFLWEEERKICATCKCNESCILRSAHVGVYGKQSTGVVKHIQHIILSCHCDVFQTFRIFILFRAARAVHDVYTCELTNQPFRLCTPSHSFTVSMPRSPPILRYCKRCKSR
jgi:hypothetical protein